MRGEKKEIIDIYPLLFAQYQRNYHLCKDFGRDSDKERLAGENFNNKTQERIKEERNYQWCENRKNVGAN